MREAVRAVTALKDRLTLNLIQKFPDFIRRKVLMVQPLDKVSYRLVKVNIVFPERVVSVDEQRLRNHAQKIYHGGTETQRRSRKMCLMIDDIIIAIAAASACEQK